MGKLEEKTDGYYVLEYKIGDYELRKGFMDPDKPLSEISGTPKPGGFCLNIPDTVSDNIPEDK